MQVRLTLLFVLSILSMPLFADGPSLGPAIEDYGPTYPINDRDVALEEGVIYRAVFDAATYSDDVTSLNSRLVSVARFINMHARNGVPVQNMDLAVVVHGAALKNVLNNAAYSKRYDVENPNLELLIDLHEAGVRFYVCGQSMVFGGVQKSELTSQAEVALSAMTMMTVLQGEGYALLQ